VRGRSVTLCGVARNSGFPDTQNPKQSAPDSNQQQHHVTRQLHVNEMFKYQYPHDYMRWF